jgi:hypothetical protein
MLYNNRHMDTDGSTLWNKPDISASNSSNSASSFIQAAVWYIVFL